jgi:5'-3' exoribonuclease 2
MLGLATHEPHFRVLREDVFFQDSKARTCNLCGQKGHKAEECRGAAKKKEGAFDEKSGGVTQKPFIWLHVSILREYLAAELYAPSQRFRFDLERALDDWVFMCFFVGNDFLPHLPSLDIRENGIDTLITIWRENLAVMEGYVTKDGEVNLERAQYIMNDLAKQENDIFRRRRKTEEHREAGAKRRKLEDQKRNQGNRNTNGGQINSPLNNGGRSGKNSAPDPLDFPIFAAGNVTKEATAMTHDMIVNRGAIFRANEANKSAATALKSRLLGRSTSTASDSDTAMEQDGGVEAKSTDQEEPQTPQSALGKRKAELIEGEDGNDTSSQESPASPKKTNDDPPTDTVRLWEDGYADRYYEQKFKVEASDIAFRHQVAAAYVQGLAWVLKYYFQGCPSWDWYYPYHYAPFAADFQNLADLKLSFDKGKPFKPFEQLMGVMPAASKHTLPEIFHGLMENEDSEIIEFYPEDFDIDLNGKKFAWQGVALLPWIDEKRLLNAMAKVYPLLSPEDAARNVVGKDVLLLSDGHPLYDEITSTFYSKKQGAPKYKLSVKVSEGLAGKIEKDESVLPWGTLSFPFSEDAMPEIESDRSLRYTSLVQCTRDELISNSVHYEMPHFNNPHKSMLLRGLQEPTPTLTQIDLEVTRNRANRSNRDQHGNSSRGNYNNNRGRGRGQNGSNSGPPRPPSGNFGFPPAPGGPPSWALPPGFPPPGGFGNGPPPPPPPGVAGYGNGSGYIPPPPGYGPPPPQYQQGPGNHQNGYRGNQGKDNHRGYRGGYGANQRY